ncbi:hypothetical protein OG921_02020 [Aldersonia sp. NBC_00410]|uniref:Rv0361 family membrane protein n=1 Tax=Aldersonia sp. NBC_00410 TaxID=2975954 RepID=UPI00224D9651|nr:hypothetical protein [Aldersonia sp. NBC_00410]MCX5041971.1 hypothetical protein [Aldersonia sp. NBC_00410]
MSDEQTEPVDGGTGAARGGESGAARGDDSGAARGGANSDQDPRTIVPFLAAVGAIAVIVIGIVVAQLVSPAADNVTETDLINTSARDFAAAVAGGKQDRIDAASCAEFSMDRAPLSGSATVVRVENVKVDGDHGTADVTVETDGAETTSAWVFTRANDHWRVCD